MQRAAAKKAGKVWTAFTQIAVTDKMRDDSPLLKNAHSIYANSWFEVHCFACASSVGAWMQVTVRRHADVADITWEQMQKVKNELFGEASVALELYPAKNEEWKPAVNVRVMYITPVGWPIPFGLGTPTAWGRSDG